MSSPPGLQVIPQKTTTSYFFDIPGNEVLVHCQLLVTQSNCHCGEFQSSYFPAGWIHQWILTLSKASPTGEFQLRVDGARGNYKRAHFWLKIGDRSLAFDGFENSYTTNNVKLRSSFLDEPIDITIRITLDKDLDYVKTRRQLPNRDVVRALLSRRFVPDVLLIACNGQSVQAHWKVLASRSSVFSTMFEESKKNKTSEIKIELDYETLRGLLSFVYAGQVDFKSVEMGKSLVKAGQKFMIDELKSAAEDFLCESLNLDNAIDLLVFADKYNTPLLGKHALTILKMKSFVANSIPEVDLSPHLAAF